MIAVARTTGCEIVVTLGALLGDTPHSRPIRCTGSATDEVLAARLGMQRSRYEGPTGIVGVLHDAVRRVGFASASIWAPVPHYVATAAQPEGDARAPRQARELLDLDLDLTDLDIAASAWERSVAEVVAGDADVQLVRRAARSALRRDRRRPAGSTTTTSDDDDEDDDDWFDEDDLPVGRIARRRLRALPPRPGRRVARS